MWEYACDPQLLAAEHWYTPTAVVPPGAFAQVLELRSVPFTQLDHLDYEATLRALQEHVGSRVAATFGSSRSEWVGGSVVGQLFAAKEGDLAAALPILEGRLGGESIFFSIGDPAHPQTMGGFSIRRNGFEWGRRVDGSTGPAVHFCVDGVTVRVMPIPPGMLPVDE